MENEVIKEESSWLSKKVETVKKFFITQKICLSYAYGVACRRATVSGSRVTWPSHFCDGCIQREKDYCWFCE